MHRWERYQHVVNSFFFLSSRPFHRLRNNYYISKRQKPVLRALMRPGIIYGQLVHVNYSKPIVTEILGTHDRSSCFTSNRVGGESKHPRYKRDVKPEQFPGFNGPAIGKPSPFRIINSQRDFVPTDSSSKTLYSSLRKPPLEFQPPYPEKSTIYQVTGYRCTFYVNKH